MKKSRMQKIVDSLNELNIKNSVTLSDDIEIVDHQIDIVGTSLSIAVDSKCSRYFTLTEQIDVDGSTQFKYLYDGNIIDDLIRTIQLSLNF